MDCSAATMSRVPCAVRSTSTKLTPSGALKNTCFGEPGCCWACQPGGPAIEKPAIASVCDGENDCVVKPVGSVVDGRSIATMTPGEFFVTWGITPVELI